MPVFQDIVDAINAQTAAVTEQGTTITAAIAALNANDGPNTGPDPVALQAALDKVNSTTDAIKASTVALQAAINGVVPSPPPPTALDIVSAIPAPNAAGVNPSDLLTVTFNRPVASANIVVTDASGNAVSTSSSIDDTKTVTTVTPSNPLSPSTKYTVTANATDVNGVAMAESAWDFTTGSAAGRRR